MKKSLIFKYVLPVSVILFYSITVERSIPYDMYGNGYMFLKLPAYGFPFIQSYECIYTGGCFYFLGFIINMLGYFILTFLIFFFVKKYVLIKEREFITVSLWVVTGVRMMLSVFI